MPWGGAAKACVFHACPRLGTGTRGQSAAFGAGRSACRNDVRRDARQERGRAREEIGGLARGIRGLAPKWAPEEISPIRALGMGCRARTARGGEATGEGGGVFPQSGGNLRSPDRGSGLQCGRGPYSPQPKWMVITTTPRRSAGRRLRFEDPKGAQGAAYSSASARVMNRSPECRRPTRTPRALRSSVRRLRAVPRA